MSRSVLQPFEPSAAPVGRAATKCSSIPAGLSVGRPPLVELLEQRRLLSTTVAAVSEDPVAAGATALEVGTFSQEAPVARYYGGTLSFGRVAGQPRRAAREVVVNVTSADAATGQVAGTLAAAGLGNVAFAGQVQPDDAFVLTTSGDVAGTLTGRLGRGGSRMSGVLAAGDGSTVRVNARALTPVGGTLAGTDAGAPNFTGSTTGTVSLRQRADALTVGTGTAATIGGRQNLDLTLDLTAQNADRTVTGTLNAGVLGTYNVAGVATGNRLTLIVTPPPAAGGPGGAGTGPTAAAGVLRLTAVGDGSRFVGRFEQATSGVFGVGRINLTRVATGVAAGGTTIGAVGSVLNADGSLLRPDGTLIAPDGTVIRVGTGTGGSVGTVGAIGTAPGATGASAANSPIGVIGTAPGATGATTANSLFGPVGTAPGATGASVTNGTTFGLSPLTPGSTGAFSGSGAFGTIRSAGTGVGSPVYAAGSTSLGSPVYTYSPVGSPAYTGTAIGTPAYVGGSRSANALGGGTGTGTGGSGGFDVVGSTSPTSGNDGLLTGQLGGAAYGTAFNNSGSIFAG